MTLSPKLGVVEISTLWHFRLPLPIQMFIKVVSSPRLSGIGMPSPILWSHPLKMQRIVLRSSLLWWELGTNSLITGPGEWLSFRRVTSKLSWSWSSVSLLLVQDNHNQDADGDHDDDGDDDVGDYGPFNSKHIQYNSSYDRILRKQICPSTPPPPTHTHPLPSQTGLYALQIIEDK